MTLLTLLVPELIWPEPDDNAALQNLVCPAVELLLSRGRRTQRWPQSLEATLSDLFDQAANSSSLFAPFRLLGESQNAPGTESSNSTYWLCADPIHLRVLQERLVLADSRQFGIELEEAHALTESLNTHLGDVCRFHVAAADRWYLELHDRALQIEIDTPPLSTATGRNVERLLPDTPEARELRKFHNEAQMLLHAHPVNEAREAAGRMPINSLWLWGGGRLPVRGDDDVCHFDGVWSVNPLAIGLARAAGVPTHPLPVDAKTFLEHAAPDTEHLVVLEDLLAPIQYENGDDYRASLADLDKRWFAPLRSELITGRVKTLRIEAPTAYAVLTWDCRRGDQLKFWRRPQPFLALAKDLASQ